MFADLFLFLAKICYFVIYPLSCIIRNLQMNPSRISDPVFTHQSLIICAFSYIIMQILENIFQAEICLWALLVMIVGVHFARRKGLIQLALQKMVTLMQKKKVN